MNMLKNIKKILTIGGTVLVSIILFSSVSVFAIQVNSAATNASSASSNSKSNPGTTYASVGASASVNASSSSKSNPGLTQAEIKVCQNRQSAINNIMSRIDIRAQNQVNLFNGIAQKVEAFYATSGKTVSNYSSLVNNISIASQKTTSDLSVVDSNSTFNCSGPNPRAMINSFRGYLTTEISDLQNLRLQVKDLIVAIAKANNVTITNQASSGN